MKWTIGIDLRPSGRGALAFARWLQDAAPAENLRFDAVHVLEESFLLQQLRHTHLADLEARLMTRSREELEHASLLDTVQPRLLEGVRAETSLVSQVEEGQADALLVGRRLGSQEEGLVRLGRVARRLLRVLPAPTVVVPGDLRIRDFGPGPVLLATDLSEHSAGAARFAKRIAGLMGRAIVVAHVVPQFDSGAMFVPSATIEQLYQQVGLEQGQKLEQWIQVHGLEGSATAIASGDVVSRLMGITAQEGAPLVVCGSRRLSTTERIFNGSVGSTLAAFGESPVAVVPSDFMG